MATFGERLKIALKNKNMKQSQLAYRLGVDRSYITNWITGKYGVNEETKKKISSILDVSMAWLSGYDAPPTNANLNFSDIGVRPITRKRFPMLGEIACGHPIFANEDHESYIDASADIDADFCLTAKGDSMIGARINDGDIVFIKQMPIVENGEIAAVVIGDEATLKVWYFYPEEQKLVLNPENRRYAPIVYTGTELDTIICLGKAVCFMSKL